MFGSYGIYKDGVFFAIVSDDILYFKINDSIRSMYEAYGSQPFSYEGKSGKSITMSYWEVPADILENHTKLAQWVEKSVSITKNTQKKY